MSTRFLSNEEAQAVMRSEETAEEEVVAEEVKSRCMSKWQLQQEKLLKIL